MYIFEFINLNYVVGEKCNVVLIRHNQIKLLFVVVLVVVNVCYFINYQPMCLQCLLDPVLVINLPGDSIVPNLLYFY